MSSSSDIQIMGNDGKPRLLNSNDAFLNALRSHSRIWKLVLKNKIICSPISSSIGKLSKDHLMSHILTTGRTANEFLTCKGQTIQITEGEIVCVKGFSEIRRVRIIDMVHIIAGNNDHILMYRISRPLIGGIHAPEEPDDITYANMNKYIAILKSYPETEQYFSEFEGFIEHLQFLYNQSKLSNFKIFCQHHSLHSLTIIMKQQWEYITSKLSSSIALAVGIGYNNESSRIYMGQIFESYLMSSVYDFLNSFINIQYEEENISISKFIKSLKYHSQMDFDIKPELQCPQYDAIEYLKQIKKSKTPVDKMIIIKKTTSLIQERVIKNIKNIFPLHDENSTGIEFATDDLILIIIWVIIQCGDEIHNTIAADIRYIDEYHFVNSSCTSIGFSFCHFQIALECNRTSSSNSFSRLDGIGKTSYNNNNNTSNNNNFETTSTSTSTSTSPDIPISICDETIRMNRNWILRFNLYNNNNNNHHSIELNSHLSTDNLIEYENDNDNGNGDGNKSNEKENDGNDFQSLGSEYDNNHRRKHDEQLNNTNSNQNSIITTTTSSTINNNKIFMIRIQDNSQYEESQKRSKKDNVDVDVDVEVRGEGEGDDIHRNQNHNRDEIFTTVRTISMEDNLSKDIRIIAICAGPEYYGVVTSTGKVFTWGKEDSGRLGLGLGDAAEYDAYEPILIPREVNIGGSSTGSRVMQLACGRAHMLAVTESGRVYAWGDNRCAQLGFSPLSTGLLRPTALQLHSPTPVLVSAVASRRVTAVACGAHHSMALTEEGQVYTWGRAADGRLGHFQDHMGVADEHLVGKPILIDFDWKKQSSDNDNDNVDKTETSSNGKVDSVPVSAPIPVVCICAGYCHSMAVTAEGVLFTWGRGTNGRLGHGSHSHEYRPVEVRSLSQAGVYVVQVAAGLAHTVILDKHGLVFGCGDNSHGQLATVLSMKKVTGTEDFRMNRTSILTPRPIPLLTNPLHMTNSSNQQHQHHNHNHLDNRDGNQENTLLWENNISLARTVSCGSIHTCVVTMQGELLLWGAGKQSCSGNNNHHHRHNQNNGNHNESNSFNNSSNGRSSSEKNSSRNTLKGSIEQ
eukprot:gene6997-14229_t